MNLTQGKTQCFCLLDESQSVEHIRFILAVAAFLPRRIRNQSLALIKTDRLYAHPRLLRHLSDCKSAHGAPPGCMVKV